MNPIAPGIYRGIPNADYHRGHGYSKSSLDLVRHQPAALAEVLDSTEERRPTPAQSFGTAFHTRVLEPQEFESRYCLPFNPPADALATIEHMKAALDGVGAEYKASSKKEILVDLVRANVPDAVLLQDLRDAYEAEARGREILGMPQWDQLRHMRDAVQAHPIAAKLISAPGEAELSCYWVQNVTLPDGKVVRLPMRCRPDYWRHDGIMIDVKTTHDEGASPANFARAVSNFRYHVARAVYFNGADQALKRADKSFSEFSKPRAFLFLAVETTARVVRGYAKGVAVYSLDNESVAAGETEAAHDLTTLARCHKAGEFPGYPTQVQSLALPAWALSQTAALAVQQ